MSPRDESQHQRQRFHLTDFGNAERLVGRHGRDLRFASGINWLAWNGKRWQPDNDGEVVRRLKETVRSLYIDAAAIDDPDERDELIKHALRSEAAGRIKAAITLAESECEVVVATDALDTDPMLLTVENGTLDLTSGELREHRRLDLITRIAPTVYKPGARHPLWNEHLKHATDGESDFESFLQRFSGYTITGRIDEEVCGFLHGPGATGKTTHIEAHRAMLGFDLSRACDFESFTKRRGDGGIRADIARLQGARLITAVESERGKQMAESALKLLTGGDRISARFLYANPIEFAPIGKIWLAANHRPAVDPHDSAMWRRLLLLPFTNVVRETKRDPDLKRRFKHDPDVRSAVLAWSVEGCAEWLSSGLAIPERVKTATDAYRIENDPLREFIAEVCVLDANASVLAGDLHHSYELWACANGERPANPSEWGDGLRARGCEKARGSQGVKLWRGITLKEGVR